MQNSKYQYIDTEDGNRTLLILHGMAGNKETMFDHTKSLHKQFRCIYLDLPGHNHFPLGDIRNLSGFGTFVKGFINELGLNEFGLLGYSFGGNVALDVIADDKFRDTPTCIWASPAFGREKNSPRIMIRMASYIPYELWDKGFFMKIIKLLGANFTKEDVNGMKSTDKKLLRIGVRLLDEGTRISKRNNIFSVMDPEDPFVESNPSNQYDVVISGCGHSGKREQVELALRSISDFFSKSLEHQD